MIPAAAFSAWATKATAAVGNTPIGRTSAPECFSPASKAASRGIPEPRVSRPTTNRAGPVAAVVVGGVGAIAVALLWSRAFPALRNQRTLDKKMA